MIGCSHNAKLIEDFQLVQKRVFKRTGKHVIYYQEDAVEYQYLNLGVWIIF